MEHEPCGKSTGTNQETGLKTGFTKQEWDDMKDENGNPQPKLDMGLDEKDQRLA